MGKSVKSPEIISNVNFALQPSDREDYDYCEFVNCTFSDISQLNFIECTFRSCNLSNCKLNNCKFQDVSFIDCKLLGLNFFQAKDFAFAVNCIGCNMDYASFDSKKLNKSRFENCKMHSVNFTMADLVKAELVNCDLYEAIFNQTNLSGVDLTKVTNFSIDPEMNKMKQARLRAEDLERLLYKYDLIIQ